jgi:hypothetical protein
MVNPSRRKETVSASKYPPEKNSRRNKVQKEPTIRNGRGRHPDEG